LIYGLQQVAGKILSGKKLHDQESPPFDKLRAGFLAQKTREKWGTRIVRLLLAYEASRREWNFSVKVGRTWGGCGKKGRA
jgi:hypothetical protein